MEGDPVDPTLLSNEDLAWGENYFFYLGTKEVKRFCSRKEYKDCTVEREESYSTLAESWMVSALKTRSKQC